MPDDLENLLSHFRPADPPPHLREKILNNPLPTLTPNLHLHPTPRRWPTYLYRSAIAATLLLSFTLFHVANNLNQNSATNIGIGPPRWTPEAQAAADLIDPTGTTGRQYIALCLLADRAHASTNNPAQGEAQ